MTNLKQAILQGIPSEIPTKRNINTNVSHAPNRKNILNKEFGEFKLSKNIEVNYGLAGINLK